MTARALVTVKNGTVPIKFINPWDDSIKLYANSKVAVIEGQSESVKTEVFAHEQNACGERAEKNAKEPEFHISKDLLIHDREKLKSLLRDYDDVFAKDDFDLGCAKRFTHNIDTGENSPVRQRP